MRTFKFNIFGIYFYLEISKESPKKRRERERLVYEKDNIHYSLGYVDWCHALSGGGGYEDSAILNKVFDATKEVVEGRACYERDGVAFVERQYEHNLLSWLLYVINRTSGQLRVLDFGGSLGSRYFQNISIIKDLCALEWAVVEQAHYVKMGRRYFQSEELKFFSSIEECCKFSSPNLILLSATLQYMADPYDFLSDLLQKDFPYLVIDRTTAHFQTGGDQLAVQHVPSWIYKANYPIWFLDGVRLEKMFEEFSYEIVDRYDPYPGSTFGAGAFSSPYVGWFLRKII